MSRRPLVASIVAVGLVSVAFAFAVRTSQPVQMSAYDPTAERVVSRQAFIDAAPPGWFISRTRTPPIGGGPLFIASVEMPDPCREVGDSITCDALPSITLPAGGIALRIDTARELLAPMSLVTPPPVGEDLLVNGYRTKMERVAGGTCAAIGADETVNIVIPTLGDWIGRTMVVACLRGPGLAESEAALLALVARAAP